MDDFQERIERLEAEHRNRFGEGERFVVNAPYRVSPLGAHVDHQHGAVTGMALTDSIVMVFRPNPDGEVRLHSFNFSDLKYFRLGEYARARDWSDYARGACMALARTHRLTAGIDAVLDGNLPIGGLSSSAAVGIAYLIALEHANGIEASSEDNIELDRIIENDFINLNNGILDQSVIILSQEEKLLHIDCRDGNFEHVSPGEGMHGYEVMVVYSGVARNLMDTDYNRRVGECEAAARELLSLAGRSAPKNARIRLRNVDPEEYDAHGHALEGNLRKRAEHFYSEVRRVREGVEAWKKGDLEKFGGLMKDSCASSTNNYECGCPPLISLAEIMNETPGVFGARFSGAGFRGCCLGFSDPSARDEIYGRVKREYIRRHPEYAREFQVRFCRPGNGAGLL